MQFFFSTTTASTRNVQRFDQKFRIGLENSRFLSSLNPLRLSCKALQYHMALFLFAFAAATICEISSRDLAAD